MARSKKTSQKLQEEKKAQKHAEKVIQDQKDEVIEEESEKQEPRKTIRKQEINDSDSDVDSNGNIRGLIELQAQQVSQSSSESDSSNSSLQKRRKIKKHKKSKKSHSKSKNEDFDMKALIAQALKQHLSKGINQMTPQPQRIYTIQGPCQQCQTGVKKLLPAHNSNPKEKKKGQAMSFFYVGSQGGKTSTQRFGITPCTSCYAKVLLNLQKWAKRIGSDFKTRNSQASTHLIGILPSQLLSSSQVSLSPLPDVVVYDQTLSQVYIKLSLSSSCHSNYTATNTFNVSQYFFNQGGDWKPVGSGVNLPNFFTKDLERIKAIRGQKSDLYQELSIYLEELALALKPLRSFDASKKDPVKKDEYDFDF